MLSTRRPSRKLATYTGVAAALIFLWTVSHIDQHSTEGFSLNPFANFQSTSPYYSPKEAGRFYSTSTPSFFPPLRYKPKDGNHTDLCAGFPTHLLDRIQVVLKTGAGESAASRTHITTVTSCIPNLLVFSDVQEYVGKHEFHPILEELDWSYYDNPDFSYYGDLKAEHKDKGHVPYTDKGAKLDRFKFLPMVEKAWMKRPGARWYVFLETDTFWFWDNLFRLLHQLDPMHMHFLGSRVSGDGERIFAEGGAGFVMSHTLIEKYVTKDNGTRVGDKFQELVNQDCCGDAILGHVVHKKTGIRVEDINPMVTGDDLATIKVDRERWCVPLLGMHRATPDQLKDLWEWERLRPYNRKPFTHATLLGYTLKDIGEKPTKDNWDNFSDREMNPGSASHTSPQTCATHCHGDPECLQWSHHAGKCRHGKYLQMGEQVSDKGAFVSGWDVEKMKDLGWKPDGDVGESCRDAVWVRPGS